MAVEDMGHVVVTLTGSIQSLGTGKVRWLSLQPGTANTAPVYLGNSTTLSSTSYGARMPPAVSGEPPAPHVIAEFTDGGVGLENFFVLGTIGEKLHVSYLPYVRTPGRSMVQVRP